MRVPPPPGWLLMAIVIAAAAWLFLHGPPAHGQRSPDDWFALVVAIQHDVEQADLEGRKIPKLDAEDRRFIRKMANELAVSAEAKPTAAQGQWLLSIRAWVDAAK